MPEDDPTPVEAIAPLPSPVAEPEPVYVPPTPAPTPEPEPVHYEPTPAHQHVPVSVPEPVAPVEEAYWETPVAPPAVPGPVADPGVIPDTDDDIPAGRGRGKGRGRRTKPAKGSKVKAPREAKPSPFTAGRGGRARLLIIRGLFWLVVGVLLLGGIKNVLSPNENLSIPEVAAKVQAETGTKGFPVAPAGAFATRFVATYLSYDPATYEQRVEALRAYSIEAAGDEYLVDATKPQQILTGPFVVDAEVQSKKSATLTVAANVTGGKWVYLAVPVYAANETTFVVSGAPGFVSAPALAAAPAAEETAEIDNDLSDELSVDLFPGFFKAWAASNVTELARYTTAKPSANTATGLRGTVSLVEVEEVKIEQGGTNTRAGTATVLWQTATGTLQQQYRITIEQGEDGRWSIADIRGGVVRSSGTSPDVQPTEEPTAGTDATTGDAASVE